MLRIEALEITDEILDKLASKHGVSMDEVEELCFSEGLHARGGRDGLLMLFGQTDAGRYLLVVLAPRSNEGVWAVVTARDMTLQERRLYKKQRGK